MKKKIYWTVVLFLNVILFAIILHETDLREPMQAPLGRENRVDPDLREAMGHSMHNKDEIIKSERCGCFYCLAIFSPGEIKEWVDDNDTALCPKCGIDSVIGSASGFPITPNFLKKMKEAWF